MQAVQFNEYGPSDVLEIAEASEPHPGPGEVRIVVHAASINPFDWKVRAGYMEGQYPVQFPLIPGSDAAGVVDELGAGVQGIQLGDAVFGLGSATYAELAVLKSFVAKPASVSFAEAAALGAISETAVRVFGLLGMGAGSTLLIDGAAGGVGSVAVQIAVARGATVIATGSARNHDYLAKLGATPISYGPGLADRVHEVAPDGVDAVFDVVGATPITDLTALVSDPAQVVSIANFAAADSGARVSAGGGGDPLAALTEVAELAGQGTLSVEVQTFPLADVAEAQDLSQQGHVRGKLVLVI